MKSKITALIKLARAGGSTYAKQWMNCFDNDGYQRTVINGDNIRLNLYKERYYAGGEAFVHAIEEIMIRTLFMNEFQHLLLDDTYTTVNSIRKILQIDPDAEFIYIDTSVEECERRAISSGQQDLVNKGVIKKMYRNLQTLMWYGHPSLEEHNRKVTNELIIRSVECIREEVKNNG